VALAGKTHRKMPQSHIELVPDETRIILGYLSGVYSCGRLLSLRSSGKRPVAAKAFWKHYRE
jgi:hypothetical protein